MQKLLHNGFCFGSFGLNCQKLHHQETGYYDIVSDDIQENRGHIVLSPYGIMMINDITTFLLE
jgi:hypothetical protein